MSYSGDRHSSRGPEGVAAAESAFHEEVRRLRRASGLSREELARQTGYSRQYVSQLEQPSRGVPPRPVVVAVDAALRADGALVALRDQAAAARAVVLRDPERQSRRRVDELLHNRRCDADLDYLDQMVGELIAVADHLSPQDVSFRVLDQQEFVDGLLHTPMLPHQQFRLYMIAGHLAGLLAIAMLDQDQVAAANACCLEAAVFTELTGHEGLRAWTLAVSRLIDETTRHLEPSATARRGEPALPGPCPLELTEQRARGAAEGPEPVSHAVAVAEPSSDPIVRRVDDLAAGRVAAHGRQAIGHGEPAGPPWSDLADQMTAPGGRASTPRLVALVKGRIARFATTTNTRPERQLHGISRAFHPPV